MNRCIHIHLTFMYSLGQPFHIYLIMDCYITVSVRWCWCWCGCLPVSVRCCKCQCEVLKCRVQTLLHLDNWEGQHTYNCHHHVTSCRVPFDLCSTGQQVNTDVKLAVPEGGSNLSSTRQYSWSNPTPPPWSVDLWSHVTGQGEAESQLMSLGHFELCDEMVLWWDDFVTRWLYYDRYADGVTT